MKTQLKTPVLLIVYKRLDTTLEVLDAIRKVKPASLYISANAPNPAKPDEVEKCEKVRNIVNLIDWNCDVKTCFRSEHLPAKLSITAGINWFFENVEEGIILEDDCLTDSSFFWFAEETLNKYRNDQRVMQITASNYQDGIPRGSSSYYFSMYNHIWGWATWKRAWKLMDLETKTLTESNFRENLSQIFPRKIDQQYWLHIYKLVKSGNIDTWDYSWMFSVWINKGLTVTPQVNLVKNLGFGQDATNTILKNEGVENISLKTLEFPLKHPAAISVDTAADQYTSDNFFRIKKSSGLFFLKLRISRILSIKTKNKIKKAAARFGISF